MVLNTKIAASIDGESETENNYKVSYKLGLTGQNGTQTDVNWYLFKSGSGQEVASAKTAPDCILKTEASSGSTKYYYATSQASEEQGTCSAKSYISSKLSDAKLVAWGKIGAGTESQALTPEEGDATELGDALTNKTPSGLDKEILYTTAGPQKYVEEYYYLVVEYPNKEQEQNNDMNKTISISLDTITNITSTLVTE